VSQPRHHVRLFVALAILIVTLYAVLTSLNGNAGFPLDDAWIHQVYGRNLALTGLFAFVPGVPSAASTAPLYTVLLAVGYWLHVPFYIWTYMLGAVGLAFTAILAERLTWRLFPEKPQLGLYAGLACVCAWHLVWVSAASMETILLIALSLGVIALAWLPKPGPRAGLAMGLLGGVALAMRPEGALVLACAGGFALLAELAVAKREWRRVIGWSVATAVGFALALAPYFALNYSLNKTLFPNTSAAKQAELAFVYLWPIWTRIQEVVTPLIAGPQTFLLPGFVYALWLLGKRIRADHTAIRLVALPVASLAILLLYAWQLPVPFQHGRYSIPALAPILILGAAGTGLLTARRARNVTVRSAYSALRIIVVSGFAVFLVIGITVYNEDKRLINTQMVDSARWITQHIPLNELLATHDIGAIGYFAPRPLLDLAGLVSPEIVPIVHDNEAVVRLMQERGVRWMMVSDFQIVMSLDDKRLCPAYTAEPAPKPIHMIIYRMAWDGNCAALPPIP